MKKVFASDFDGTMYFYLAEEDRKLPVENVEVIRRYQEAGNLFGLCTGRQVGGLTPFIGGLVSPDFYITSSGANIVDGELRTIRKKGVSPETADAIIRKYGTDRYRFTLDVEGEICVFSEMDYPGSYHVITGISDLPPGLIHQVSIHTESTEEAARMSDEINAAFGDSVNAFRNVVEIDISPKGCTKGEGVAFLRSHLEALYGPVRLYGAGDSINDIPLLESADVSYTFDYAPPEVQARATKVVRNFEEAVLDSMRD